jgi:hypothetical protein
MDIKLDSGWDLLVENREGQPTLIVEVKQKLDTSSGWVAKFHRNILVHNSGILPQAPYFLMAFPDRFYLWINNTESHSDPGEPNYTIDAEPILRPYLQGMGKTAGEMGKQSLELMILSWLGQMSYSPQPIESDSSQNWLVDSGLYQQLVGKLPDREAVA